MSQANRQPPVTNKEKRHTGALRGEVFFFTEMENSSGILTFDSKCSLGFFSFSRKDEESFVRKIA